MTLTSGTFAAQGAAAINLTGNWINNGGTFTPGTGTVNFIDTSAASAINGTAASQTFYNVGIAKAGKNMTVGGSTVTLTVNDLVENS